MVSKWLDAAIGLWAAAAATVFVAFAVGGAKPELELMGRYVYLVVIAAGVIGLAFRTMRMVRR